MAKYNREFLLPYLRSLCEIEFAGYTLYGIGEQQKEEIAELRRGKYNPEPKWHTVSVFTIDRIAFIVIGLLFIFFAFKSTTSSSTTKIVLIIIGLIPVLISLICIISSKCKNNALYEEYRRKREVYEKIEAENERMIKHDIPIIEKRQAILEEEFNRAADARNEIYSANIIPRKNRDIHVAMYLYDLFTTSRKDDLEHALDQYDEDELEDELTELIHKQLEHTNKQARLVALKDLELPAEERQSAVLRRKLEQMDISAEEKSIYSQMITGMDAVMNFYAETRYLQ